MTHVAIVGGGIAGLACAAELANRDVDFTLFEAGPRCGGPLESVRVGDYLVERGASTVRGTPELDRLFARAGLELVQGRRAAPMMVADGRLTRMPPSLAQLARGEGLPRRLWLDMLGEPFRTAWTGPHSVRELVRERLGATAADRLADLLTLGTFGTTAEDVGFESAFPDLADELARSSGRLSVVALRRLLRVPSSTPRRGLISSPGGLGALPDALAQTFGKRVRVRTPVRSIEREPARFALVVGAGPAERVHVDHVVLAIPPSAAAPLLEIAELSAFPSTPQTLAHFAIDDPACVERWQSFGFLAPGREQLPLLGCLFPSQIFSDRAPSGHLLLNVFVGPALRDADEVTLSETLAPILGRLLKTRPPELIDVARHPVGIPLYDLDHRDRLQRVRRTLAQTPGLYLAGWGYDGPGVGSAAASGIAAAQRCA